MAERDTTRAFYEAGFNELKDKDSVTLRAMADLVIRSLATSPIARETEPFTSEQLSERAERIDATLSAYLANLREQIISDAQYGRWNRGLESDLDELDMRTTNATHPGLKLDTDWLYDIVSNIIQDAPLTIWVRDPIVDMYSTVNYFPSSIPGDGRTQRVPTPLPDLSLYKTIISNDGESILEVVKLLQVLQTDNTQTDVRFLLEKSSFNSRHDLMSVKVALVDQALRASGIVQDDDPSRRVEIVRLDDLQDKDAEVVQRVLESGNFEEIDEIIRLKPWLRQWLTLLDKDDMESEMMVRHRLGMGQDIAGLAVPFFEEDIGGMHVVLAPNNTSSRSLAAILRACNRTSRDKFHGIEVTGNFRGAKFRAYEVGTFLQREMRRYIESNRAVVSFDDFDAQSYRDKNYRTVMEQDKEIFRSQVDASGEVARILGIDPYDSETLLDDDEAVHVCVGSNLYPVMLREHLSRGRIKGIDIAPSAVEYMNSLKEGRDDELWMSHEREIIQAAEDMNVDSGLFVGSARRASRKLLPALDDAHQLAPRSARLIEMHFGAEATGLERTNFYGIMRSISSALKDEASVFEGVFTLDSDIWSDGINDLPAVSMRERDYELAIIDAGLMIVGKRLIGTGLPEESKVRPGENMVYYRAVPRPGALR